MSNVIKMSGRRMSKTSQMLADALEAEKKSDTPILLIAASEQSKVIMAQQLRCMSGTRTTRIKIMTAHEILESEELIKPAKVEAPKP